MVILYRTVIMFTVIIVTMRLMGKRQMGELELNELVVAVMISELAAIPLTDVEKSLLSGIIPIVTLLICEITVSLISMRCLKFRSIISGSPSIIVKNGQIVQKEMKKNRFTLDELVAALRTNSITDISTIKYAILETDGSLNTVLYNEHTPVTNKSIGKREDDNGIPLLIINDGRVLRGNLEKIGLDDNWLQKELQKRHLKNPSDVFLLSIDENKNIYFASKQ